MQGRAARRATLSTVPSRGASRHRRSCGERGPPDRPGECRPPRHGPAVGTWAIPPPGEAGSTCSRVVEHSICTGQVLEPNPGLRLPGILAAPLRSLRGCSALSVIRPRPLCRRRAGVLAESEYTRVGPRVMRGHRPERGQLLKWRGRRWQSGRRPAQSRHSPTPCAVLPEAPIQTPPERSP